jgi:ketosteroid isomerase-like protein
VEERWVEAHRTLDLQAIEAILSEEYRQLQSDGTVIGKRELLASYRSGTRHWETARSDELEVFLQGEIAWVIGKWHGKGYNAAEAFDYQARFLAVYRMEAGEWKLAADVSIPIA